MSSGAKCQPRAATLHCPDLGWPSPAATVCDLLQKRLLEVIFPHLRALSSFLFPVNVQNSSERKNSQHQNQLLLLLWLP